RKSEFQIGSERPLMRNGQFLIGVWLSPMRKSEFLIGSELPLIRNGQFLIGVWLSPMRKSEFLIGSELPLIRNYQFLIWSGFAQQIGEGTQKAQTLSFLCFLCPPMCLLWFVPAFVGQRSHQRGFRSVCSR